MISKISMITIVVVGGAVGIGVGVARRCSTAVAVARVRVAWKKTLSANDLGRYNMVDMMCFHCSTVVVLNLMFNQQY